MTWLAVAIACALSQDGLRVHHDDPHHSLAELELGPEGARIEHRVRFTGALSIWAWSDAVDPRLVVVVAGSEELLDDDGGGGTTAWISTWVQPGDTVSIAVLGRGSAASRVELHVVAAPETEATRTTWRDALEELDEIDRLRQESALEEACTRVAALVDRLVAASGSRTSGGVGEALWRAGLTAHALSAFAAADAAWTHAHAVRERLLPPDHPDVLSAKQNLAVTRKRFGDLRGALALEEAVHAARERLLPPDHVDLLAAKGNLAATRAELGDHEGALALEETVLAALERLLPPDHPDLLRAKGNLANTRRTLGDLEGALALEEAVLAARERLLPAEHPDILRARGNLAVTRKTLGDLTGALVLEEAVHAARARVMSPDHPDLLVAKVNLAATRAALGDLYGAQALLEEAHAIQARLLPADHPDLLRAKVNLADVRRELGDPEGALVLEEAVHEAWELLGPDHPDLLALKGNLAATRRKLGDRAGSLALFEEVHAARERSSPPNHPHLLLARNNLAVARYALGDFEGARELFETVLEARARLLPRDHPDLISSRHNLAVTRSELDDHSGASELLQTVHGALEQLLPSDHGDLLDARRNLALVRLDLGDLHGARELTARLLSGLRDRAVALRAEAARPAREGVRTALPLLFTALFLTERADPDGVLDPELFAALEGLRQASVAAPETARLLAANPQLADLARAVGEWRSKINDLVAVGADGSVETWRAALLSLSEERDRAERALRRKLAEAGAFAGELAADTVATRFARDSAAASFLRYPRSLGEGPGTVDSFLSFVVKSDGSVRRVELGPAAEIDSLVAEWRSAMGRSLGGRGIGVSAEAESVARLESLGRHLRARVLDPVVRAAGNPGTLHVVLDDLLHVIPFDALPLEEGLVGERLQVRSEVTLARLLDERVEVVDRGGLTAAGGIDYDAEPSADAFLCSSAATPFVPQLRSGGTHTFAALPETGGEVESVAARYRAAFGHEAGLLSGSLATRDALRAAASKTRFLHVATHGWFAEDALRSQLDDLARSNVRVSLLRASETLRGFAPETLCGLALAGANRGADASGRAPGILTAEELATLDLSNCELAVLSACETNVGVRRAGQGIQSLQAALYAAGARSSITSLWKVDDAATRRLFELFYTYLWEDGLPKAEALWQAKRALREEGAPVRDWAAWVLTGDPE